MNKYSPETLEKLKEEFCTLLLKVNREGAKIDDLIAKLDSSDFFIAPASTKFHNSFEGGLVDHSLNVYYNLKSLVDNKHLNNVISDESIIICGLLHDMSKMNFYEKTAKNKKVYSPTGSKFDELGKFDWVSEMGYAVKPEEQRFVYGNHEENSEFMVRHYIPLTLDESMAILHHHFGMGHDSTQMNLSGIYSSKPLVTLLHVADMIATFVDEGVFING